MADRRYRTKRWRVLRTRILHRDGFRCTTPGCTIRPNPGAKRFLVVDHIWEVEDGGPFWDPTNLRTLCWSHHTTKTRQTRLARPPHSYTAHPQPVSPNA